MNTVEMIQYSLGNALGILSQVTADLTQEQSDWLPPGTANPIGALYWHALTTTDMVVHLWGTGKAPLSQQDKWRGSLLIGSGTGGEDDSPAMRDIRVNLSTMHEYAKVVQETTLNWVASLTPADLQRKIETSLGELTLAQALDLYAVWHVNVHCGEISALKGCQGAKGYPF